MTYGIDATSDFVLGAIADLAPGTSVAGVVARYGHAMNEARQTATEINNIENDPGFSPEMKDALIVLQLMDLARGNTFHTDLPMTFDQAWAYVNNIPANYGGGTKEQFWAKLAAQFPNDFHLDGSGHLIEPTFLTSPPTTPDYTHLDTPDLPSAVSAGISPVSTAFAAGETTASPLVLDLGTGGINVTALNSSGSVYWDIDNDGFREASGWIAGNSALLAIDKNSDGVINNNSELFGNNATYANGFANLAQYDSNSDGHITSADTHFGDLIVWTDDNHDGVSQSSELHTLSSLSITDINLSYTASSTTINGNAVNQTGTFTMGGVSHAIDDVWFAYDNINSEYDQSYTLDISTVLLPDLRGYGTLPDLHIAMSIDNAGTGNLLGLVQDIAGKSLTDLLSPSYDLQGALQDILYRWAGVDGVDPTSRGVNADAQQLEFLEKLMGQPFVQQGIYSDPTGYLATDDLHAAWMSALGAFGGNLLAQSSLGSLFGSPEYDLRSDSFSGTTIPDGIVLRFNTSGVDESISGSSLNDVYIFHAGDSPTASGQEILTELPSNGMDTVLFGGINPADVRMWDDGGGSLYVQYSSTDNLRIYDSSSGANTVSSRVEHIAFDNGTVWDLTQGLPLTDSDTAHTLYGSAQADTIDGRGGNDTISAYGGNDTIIGGTGSDSLYGGTGDDTFVFSPGDGPGSGSYDYIYEMSGEGTDTILIHGVLPSDVRTWTDGSNNLYVQYSATDALRINGDGSSGANTTSNYVEHIAFDNGTVWDLTQGLPLTDTDDAHALYGSNQADTIDGRGGNDTISAYGGNDTIIGGAGSDSLYGGTGDDTFVFSPGDGPGSGSYDYIYENSGEGTDTILIHGVLPSDVRSWTDTSGNLYIQYSGTDALRVAGSSFGASTIPNQVEHIAFDNGTVWDFSAGLQLTDTDDGHVMNGSDLADVIDGRGGNDSIYGYGGNDIIQGGAGNDYLDGGDGTDSLSYALATSAVTISLAVGSGQATGGAGTDTIANFENLTGSAYNDTLTGDGNANVIDGGQGNDTMDGAGGVDTLTYAAATAGVTVSLAIATAQNTVGAGTDTVSNFENLTGSAFNDVLTGDASANVIDGGNGDDIIQGGAGNDTLIGGGGTDTLTYAAAASAVTVNLTTATAQNTVGAGTDTISGFENLIGSAFNDTLTGDGNANTIEGGAGNDTLNGAGGIDTLSYLGATAAVTVNLATTTAQNTVGAGTDTISNFENLVGSAFNDTLTGDGNANTIEGGAGNDTINGAGGVDTLTYANATSAITMNLATTTAQATGGAGSDTVSNFENLTGSAFNDTLTGNTGDNVIDGGAGNDTIQGGAGNDTVIGGLGTDTLSYSSASSAITVSLALATAQVTGGAGTDTISGFENLTGSASADTLTGDANANVIDGGAGNDTIDGGAGNDTLTGNSGTDTLTYASAASGVAVSLAITTAQNTGGAGTDTIATFENLTGSAFGDVLTGDANANTILGGDGDDTIQGGAGNDILTGGNGIDTVSYAAAASAITFNLATTTSQNTVGAGSDTVSGFENILGSAFNDTLTGDGNANTIQGGAGNDTLNGAGGIDTLSYDAASAAVTVNLATTTAQNTVGAGTDTISNFENLTGSAFNDTLTGDGNANTIDGGAGNDTLNGAGGTDTLSYASATSGVTVNLATGTAQNTIGAGTDTISNFENLTGSAFADTLTGDSNANVIHGGAGNDTLHGAGGADTLYGDAGADIFAFEATTAFSTPATIGDFNTGQGDAIDIHDLLVGFNPVTSAIHDFVSLSTSGSDTIVSVDRDGTGGTYTAQAIATISGVTGLDVDDLYNNGHLIAA